MKYYSDCDIAITYLPMYDFCRTQLLIMQELVNTELDYIHALEYVIDNYVPEMNHTLLPQPLRGKKNVVFANLEKIHEFHSQCFIRLLRQCMNSPFQLGSCILQHVRCSTCVIIYKLLVLIGVYFCEFSFFCKFS